MRVRILGFYIDNIIMDEALRKIEEFVSSGTPHKLTLPNPYILLEARKNPALGRFIHTADLVLPDGVGLVLAGRILGNPIKERIAGSDIIYILSDLASKKRWGMYFIGAKDGVAKRASEILQQKYHGLKIVGIHHGYFTEEEEKNIIEDILLKKPDILIVCLGVGKQEMFIERNFFRINVPVSFGNGAAFDFVAEEFRRAPIWVQRCGLEWFFRLVQEPRRLWKRYLVGNMVFLWLVLKEVFNMKKREESIKIF